MDKLRAHYRARRNAAIRMLQAIDAGEFDGSRAHAIELARYWNRLANS